MTPLSSTYLQLCVYIITYTIRFAVVFRRKEIILLYCNLTDYNYYKIMKDWELGNKS